jgi:hypothetical protein
MPKIDTEAPNWTCVIVNSFCCRFVVAVPGGCQQHLMESGLNRIRPLEGIRQAELKVCTEKDGGGYSYGGDHAIYKLR